MPIYKSPRPRRQGHRARRRPDPQFNLCLKRESQSNLLRVSSPKSSSPASQASVSNRVGTNSPSAHVSVVRVANDESDRCARIDDQIDRINARMRSEYSAPEGEELRERLRKLSDQRWRCSR
jgi:hypothetical protein